MNGADKDLAAHFYCDPEPGMLPVRVADTGSVRSSAGTGLP